MDLIVTILVMFLLQDSMWFVVVPQEARQLALAGAVVCWPHDLFLRKGFILGVPSKEDVEFLSPPETGVRNWRKGAKIWYQASFKKP